MSLNDIKIATKDKTDLKNLGKGLSRADLALSDPSWAIHGVSPVLEEAMEVQAGGFIAKLVGKMYRDLFPHLGIDSRRRPLSVDGDHRSLMQAIRIFRQPTDVPVILNSRYKYARDDKA